MNTKSVNEKIKTVALAVVALLALTAIVSVLPSSDADTGEETSVDLGQKYSMKVQFIFSGSDASSILWEFGDGETSEDWNPLHEYAATGIYHGKQTVYNSYNGGSSTVLNFTVEIMGYPEITFVSNGGSEVASIEQTAYNVVATQPEDPVREGYTFDGWYLDEDLTQVMDWTSGIKKDITLYAGWTAVGSGNGNGGEDPVPPSEDNEWTSVQIACGALGALLLLGAIISRRPVLALVGIVALAAMLGMHYEVF